MWLSQETMCFRNILIALIYLQRKKLYWILNSVPNEESHFSGYWEIILRFFFFILKLRIRFLAVCPNSSELQGRGHSAEPKIHFTQEFLLLTKCSVKNNPFVCLFFVKISENIYDSLIYGFYNCMQLAHHTALISYVKKLLLDNFFLL